MQSLRKNWINLTGLYWLSEGQNNFGSDTSGHIVFPENAPAYIGSYFLLGDDLQLRIDEKVEVYSEDSLIRQMKIIADQSPKLKHGHYEWMVIKRSGQYAIRLWDNQSEKLKNFKGLDYYPVDNSWRIKASFQSYEPPKILPIENIFGIISDTPSPGKLNFKIDGNQYSLDMLDGGEDQFFAIFADNTNGEGTYELGRYMYIPRPDDGGYTYIDFNRAYNPPCVFTEHATCPIPPSQNSIGTSIFAGEKYSH